MFKKEKKNDTIEKLQKDVIYLKKAREWDIDRIEHLESFQDAAISKIEALNARLMELEAGKTSSVSKANITVEDAMNVLSTFCGNHENCMECRFCTDSVDDQYGCYLRNNIPDTW